VEYEIKIGNAVIKHIEKAALNRKKANKRLKIYYYNKQAHMEWIMGRPI